MLDKKHVVKQVQVIELTCCSLSLLHMILRAVAADECTYSDTYIHCMHTVYSKQLATSQICVSGKVLMCIERTNACITNAFSSV
jgi:hypothetical protein